MGLQIWQRKGESCIHVYHFFKNVCARDKKASSFGTLGAPQKSVSLEFLSCCFYTKPQPCGYIGKIAIKGTCWITLTYYPVDVKLCYLEWERWSRDLLSIFDFTVWKKKKNHKTWWLRESGHIYHVPAKLWIWVRLMTFAAWHPFVSYLSSCFPVFNVLTKQKCLKIILMDTCNNRKHIKYFQTSDKL